VATDSRRWGEGLSKAMVHLFLSRKFDDRLSILLIRSASSLTWSIAGLGALLSFIVLFLPQAPLAVLDDSVVRSVLISYAVLGIVWNSLAALAHSASSGSYGRGLLLFAIWPLAFAYNWRETMRGLHA
jgi:hypothetical protein